jgi:hypothetical protein
VCIDVVVKVRDGALREEDLDLTISIFQDMLDTIMRREQFRGTKESRIARTVYLTVISIFCSLAL